MYYQGRSDGGYIPPESVYLTNIYVVTGCFFSLTQDKFDIVPVCALARVSFTYLHTTIYTPPQMKFLARPLCITSVALPFCIELVWLT